MHLCKKCGLLGSIVLLAIGVAFLLVDLGIWTFWGLNWWTVGILFFGLIHLGTGHCKDCCDVKPKKK